MAKWWNTVSKWCNNRDLNLIMVRWCKGYGKIVHIIHTSSHGEMVKHSSGDILFEKWRNGETVMLTFSALSFILPLDNGKKSRFLTPPASVSDVSGKYRIDPKIVSWAAHTPFDAVPPRCFWSILFFFTFLPPLPALWGCPLLQPTHSRHCSLFLYWRYIILSLCYCNICNFR